MRSRALIAGLVSFAAVAACADPPELDHLAARIDEDCGRLLVSDRDTDTTVELDACTGEEILRQHHIVSPSAAARSDDGRLFITSFDTGAVYCGEAEPFYRDRWFLQEPVALNARGGELFVLGRDTRHFVVLSPRGARMRAIGGPALDRAHDFVFGDDGLIYVTTSWNPRTEGRVQVWNPDDGTLMDDFAPELSVPIAIDQGPDLRLYVADWGNDHVVRFEPDGTRDVAFELAVRHPLGLAIGPHGALFVSSEGAVLRVDDAGVRVLRELGEPRALSYVDY